MRALVRETRLSPDMFVLPLFVCEGEGVRREVASMPGVFNLSVDEAVKEVEAAKADGVNERAALRPARSQGRHRLGAPTIRKRRCSPRSARSSARSRTSLVITDVCLCEYTDHGHCGIVIDEEIANDPTVDQLVRAAVSHAAAGADIVAPSDMMDGRVGAIRQALDERGFEHMAIMSYAAKYCSAFYGPFREAAGVGAEVRRPAIASDGSGQRRRGAARSRAGHRGRRRHRDGEAGDPYLDVIARVKDAFGYPTAAYHVSGEYAMLKAAARNGWIDEPRAMLETLTSIRRAGADIIITYYAREPRARLPRGCEENTAFYRRARGDRREFSRFFSAVSAVSVDFSHVPGTDATHEWR